ncbi:MAG: hypothetical protein HC828_04780 [Blastochloris sp.]|nr:hypothetical protein [Blastochloris sp.]
MAAKPRKAASFQVVNVRSEPWIAADTMIAKLCPGDSLEYVSMQDIGDERWYRVRVAAAGLVGRAGRAMARARPLQRHAA